jgi:hypothetical protein
MVLTNENICFFRISCAHLTYDFPIFITIYQAAVPPHRHPTLCPITSLAKMTLLSQWKLRSDPTNSHLTL